jgi:hypothetical protein
MDFGVVDVQKMSLISDQFREYWCNRNHILIKWLKDTFHGLFLIFFGGGGGVMERSFTSYRVYTNVYSVILSLVKFIAMKDTLISG